MDLDTLRKDYDTQKSGGKGNMQFDAFKMDEEIDVVGLDSRQETFLCSSKLRLNMENRTADRTLTPTP